MLRERVKQSVGEPRNLHCLPILIKNSVCDQRRTSAIFAQASPSRLSESCRVSFWVLVRVFRLGNLCQDWATNTLAWAREARLSKNGSPKRGREETLVLVTLNLRPCEEIRVFEREGGSPKRDNVVHTLFHAHSGEVD
ncbi:hypothetical protein DEO72_LG3g2456 [Vigna unguiculata]|uniref:Uncharacterized protein n=1 Tax=Vigna unguiculata TaxID=3917 RepID=A0A4D6LHT3_VIGUN|nr:hypothetical protein DEO72_LG3g2456 [Vigna unguiculata]